MPAMNHHHSLPANSKRRIFLGLGLLAFCYPLLRFIGFKLPSQPRLFEVKKKLTNGAFHLEPDFILFAGENGPWALSRKCTHLGCKLNYREKERLLECPCHQSRFNVQGEVLAGPAKRNLPRFKVEKLNDDSGYLVTI
jgi:nitrite reductase/ring-hydroxylating ferredoxin subunit